MRACEQAKMRHPPAAIAALRDGLILDIAVVKKPDVAIGEATEVDVGGLMLAPFQATFSEYLSVFEFAGAAIVSATEPCSWHRIYC
jgi:hypothetical protein